MKRPDLVAIAWALVVMTAIVGHVVTQQLDAARHAELARDCFSAGGSWLPSVVGNQCVMPERLP